MRIFGDGQNAAWFAHSLNLLPDFVIHCLRPTYGPDFREGGAHTFMFIDLSGYSSVTPQRRWSAPSNGLNY
jgi:hypothetical protein